MSVAQYWFRRRPRLALSAIVATGLVILILVLEVGARIIFPAWGPTFAGDRITFCEHDDLLGWVHKPGVSGNFSREEFSVEVNINSYRLRDREYSLKRNEKNRMLILGDSFGWGHGVDLADRFDEILETRYADWEIINASVSGYGTDQQFLYLKDQGIAFRPDVVLLLLYSNDFVNNSAASQYFLNKPYFTLDETGLELHNTPVPSLSIMQRLAHLVGRTYILGRAYIGVKQLFVDLRRYRDQVDEAPDSSGDYQLTTKLISSIQNVSREIGADFILVSLPMEDESKAALRELSETVGFPYLPLDEFFENSDNKNTFFPMDGHLNADGHRLAADTIDAFLTEINVFEGTAAMLQ